MTVCSDLAEFKWLTGSDAGALLAELAGDDTPLHLAVARLRDRLSPVQTHLLLEQVELRRRAAAKFTHPERMFFSRVGLEQATDEWIARYKASRFAPQRAGSSARLSSTSSDPEPVEGSSSNASTPAIADLCCGIGGDLLAFAELGSAIGIDQDPIAAHFAAVNTGTVVRATDVAEFDFDGINAWHIDPDRRPAGHRTTALEWCQPDRDTIDRLLTRVPHAAVKLAPATKPPAEWAERCELEWISRDRECRQLVAWHGDLAQSPGLRRATVLSTAQRDIERECASTARGLAPRSILGQPNQPIPIVERPDRYVFDADPAVVAARLTGVLAAQHELAALAAGPTYLTGPHPIDDPALGCFEVQEVLPLRVRTLARHLRAKQIGHLEIKKRGVEIEPEKLRRDLRLSGSNVATLLIAPIAGRPIAILARRVST